MTWRQEDGLLWCPLCTYRIQSDVFDPEDLETALQEHELAHGVTSTPTSPPTNEAALARSESCRGLAVWLAQRAVASKPMIDMEEAVGDAFLALVEASVKFDDTRGVHFTEYARPRITGAILDGHYRRSRAIYTNRTGQSRSRHYPEKDQPLESFKGFTTDPFRERIIDLVDALATIPSHQARAVVSLAAGLTLREIADAEDRTIPTVAMRATHGRTALKEKCRY